MVLREDDWPCRFLGFKMQIKRIPTATSHLYCNYLSFWWNSIRENLCTTALYFHVCTESSYLATKNYVTDFQGIIMECNLTLWYCWMLLNRNLKFLNFKTSQCCCKLLRNSFWKVRLGRRTLEVFMKSVIADKTIILSQIQNQNPGSLYCWVSY